MGRLIDADALKNEIADQLKSILPRTSVSVSAYMTAFVAEKMVHLINRWPTAYDVEKVVDHVRQDCYSMGFDESQTEIVVADIRKGGVE